MDKNCLEIWEEKWVKWQRPILFKRSVKCLMRKKELVCLLQFTTFFIFSCSLFKYFPPTFVQHNALNLKWVMLALQRTGQDCSKWILETRTRAFLFRLWCLNFKVTWTLQCFFSKSKEGLMLFSFGLDIKTLNVTWDLTVLFSELYLSVSLSINKKLSFQVMIYSMDAVFMWYKVFLKFYGRFKWLG